MSQENVESVRRLNAAFNGGNARAFAEVCDDVLADDAHLRDLANAPDQADVIQGRDAIVAALGLWADAFDELHADVDEYMDVGAAVICAVRWRGQGKGSGVSVDQRGFDVEFRDGRIVNGTLGYQSKDEALQAAGLRE